MFDDWPAQIPMTPSQIVLRSRRASGAVDWPLTAGEIEDRRRAMFGPPTLQDDPETYYAAELAIVREIDAKLERARRERWKAKRRRREFGDRRAWQAWQELKRR